MTAAIAKLLYESPFYAALGPFWSAYSVGFCVIGVDGRVRLTAAGQAYLAERGI